MKKEKRKCRDCVNLEEFDFDKVGFRNKCALLDLWDMDIQEPHECEYFQEGPVPVDTMPEMPKTGGKNENSND